DPEEFSARQVKTRVFQSANSEVASGGNMAAIATPSFMPSGNRVLVASADPIFRTRMLKNCEFAGSLSEEAEGGAHALSKLLHFACDSVLLDRNLPDLDATEVAELIRQRYPQTEVEFFDSRNGGSELQDEKSFHVGKKPLEDEAPWEAEERIAAPAQGISGCVEPLPGMIGTGGAIQQVYRFARMVAPRDTTVLITGETGTGKELVAQALHQLSPRVRQPFVV